MAIGFGTAGVMGVSTTGSLAPALPASLAAGDFMIAHMSPQASAAMSVPGGWAALATQANAEVPNFVSGVYWKFAGASETSPTFAAAGAAVLAGVISRWTGVPQNVNPWQISPVQQQSSGTTMAGLTMTTLIDNGMALWFWAQDDNGVTAAVTNSASIAYGGASYNTTTGGGTNLGCAYKLITTHGATGATNMTSASGTQNMFIGCALDPTPVAASLPPLLMPKPSVTMRALIAR